MIMKSTVYHERQQWRFCGVHALNALAQGPAFSPEIMDDIAAKLSHSTGLSHKSWFPIGNYDVNVLELACVSQGWELSWIDQRVDLSEQISRFELQESLLGLVLNLESWKVFGMTGNHWIGIKRISECWWDLDSKLEEPFMFEDSKALVDWLVKMRLERKAKLFSVSVKSV